MTVMFPGFEAVLAVAGFLTILCQIMVTFMLLSTTSISSYVACYLSYRNFFNSRKQL